MSEITLRDEFQVGNELSVGRVLIAFSQYVKMTASFYNFVDIPNAREIHILVLDRRFKKGYKFFINPMKSPGGLK